MASDPEFEKVPRGRLEDARLDQREAQDAVSHANCQPAMTAEERAGIALIKEEVLEEPFVNFRLYPYPHKGEERSYFIRPQFSPAVLEASRARQRESRVERREQEADSQRSHSGEQLTSGVAGGSATN